MKELWEIFGRRPEISVREVGLPESAALAAVWTAWLADNDLVRDIEPDTAWDELLQLREVDEERQERFDLAAAMGDWQEGLAVLLGGVASAEAAVSAAAGGDRLPVGWIVGENGSVTAARRGGDAATEFSRRVAAGDVAGDMIGDMARQQPKAEQRDTVASEMAGRAADADMRQTAADRSDGGRDYGAVRQQADAAVWAELGRFLPGDGVAAAPDNGMTFGAESVRREQAGDMAAGRTAAGESVPERMAEPAGAVDIDAVSRQVADILSDGLMVALGSRSFVGRA